jgi:hypothetical protein
MRSVSMFLGTLLLLVAVSAGSALAASPGVLLTTDAARKFVIVSFTNLKTVSKVSYTLVYDSGQSQKGFEGGFRNPSKLLRTTRKQILGTCSSGKCVYHRTPKNLQLNATFTLRTGGVVKASKTLK